MKYRSHGIIIGAVMSMGVITALAETTIVAEGPLGPLRGSLLRVESSEAPVVLIIPGSGPTDRDGNSGNALQASSYRLIAEGLFQKGITTVRIDKRGMFGSAAAVTDANAVTIADYVSDIEAWVKVIQATTNKKCVWLLGHSEGGLVALAAAQKLHDLCGLLLVATPGRPFGDVLAAQLKANPTNVPIIEEALATIDRLKTGQRVDTSHLHPALAPLFDPSIQGFMIDLFSCDPAKLAGRYNGPILILQGKKDIQVAETDARLLASANPNTKLVLLENTNHVLKEVSSDELDENLATYTNPNLQLAEGVVTSLGEFVSSQK